MSRPSTEEDGEVGIPGHNKGNVEQYPPSSPDRILHSLNESNQRLLSRRSLEGEVGDDGDDRAVFGDDIGDVRVQGEDRYVLYIPSLFILTRGSKAEERASVRFINKIQWI